MRGEGYAYDHDAEDGFSGQNYFPEGMKRGVYYQPVDRGLEIRIREKLERLRAMDVNARKEGQ